MTDRPTPDPGRKQVPPVIITLSSRGEKGDKGDKGDPGPAESALVPIAMDMVEKLTKSRRRQKWVNAGLAVGLAVLVGVVLTLIFWVIPAINAGQASNSAYVNAVVQHECRALELLTKTPVSYPADPAKNPSRVDAYNFYEAILYWEHSDNCTP